MSKKIIQKKPGILLNRVSMEFDQQKFRNLYQVLHTEFSVREKRNEAVRLLTPYDHLDAFRYEYGGTSFYTVFSDEAQKEKAKGILNRIVLDVPSKDEGYKDVGDSMFLDLLLNGMNKDQDEPYSNLDGGFYTFDEEDVHEDEGRIVTLCVKFRDAETCPELFGKTKILFNAQTFADQLLVKECPNKKAIKDLVGYVRKGNRLVLPKFELDGKKRYVRHGYPKMTKASLPFYSFEDIRSFDYSKAGRIRHLLKRMEHRYRNIGLKLDFVRTYDFDENSYFKEQEKDDEEFSDYFKKLIAGRKVYLKDNVKSEDSERIIRGISADLRKEFGVEVIPSEDIVEGEFNFNLVNKKRHDPNHATNDHIPLQNLSVASFRPYYKRLDQEVQAKLDDDLFNNEDFRSRAISALSVMMVDLLIKEDAITNQHRVFEWFKTNVFDKAPVNALDRKWTFYDRVRVQNHDVSKKKAAVYADEMGCLTMDVDGSFDFQLISKSDAMDDPDLYDIYRQFNDRHENLKGIISDGTNVYMILTTDVLMLPELDGTREQLVKNEEDRKAGKEVGKSEYFRKQETYQLFLKACTNIHYCHKGEYCFYFVGNKLSKVQPNVQWAANMYAVKRLRGDQDFPPLFFDMLMVPFVKNNQPTITPYPFKYLHEFERIHGLEEEQTEDDDEPPEISGKEDTRKKVTLEAWMN